MRLLVVLMLCGALAACATPGGAPEPYRPPRITHPSGQPYTPDAAERADIAATLRPALGGRQPEFGELVSRTAHGGIETCGTIRSGSAWRAFAMMRPPSGKPDIQLPGTHPELSIREICASEGLPLRD